MRPLLGKSATGATRAGEFIRKQGQIVGEIRCVRGWHALGQPVSHLFWYTKQVSKNLYPQNAGLTPSRDILSTGAALRETCNLVKSMNPLSHRINEVIRGLDPSFHEKLLKLREQTNKHEAFMDAFSKIDCLLLEGREFLFNRLSGLHTDSQDPQLGWAVLFALGDFTGGHVGLPHLGLRVRLQPGDMILLRGRVVQHEIEPWEGGQRIGVPHFTHTSLWNAFGMKDDVSL